MFIHLSSTANHFTAFSCTHIVNKASYTSALCDLVFDLSVFLFRFFFLLFFFNKKLNWNIYWHKLIALPAESVEKYDTLFKLTGSFKSRNKLETLERRFSFLLTEYNKCYPVTCFTSCSGLLPDTFSLYGLLCVFNLFQKCQNKAITIFVLCDGGTEDEAVPDPCVEDDAGLQQFAVTGNIKRKISWR